MFFEEIISNVPHALLFLYKKIEQKRYVNIKKL